MNFKSLKRRLMLGQRRLALIYKNGFTFRLPKLHKMYTVFTLSSGTNMPEQTVYTHQKPHSYASDQSLHCVSLVQRSTIFLSVLYCEGDSSRESPLSHQLSRTPSILLDTETGRLSPFNVSKWHFVYCLIIKHLP